ncbi:MAG: DUF624 domain-containing protein [Anaerolineae bacterium]
MRRHWRDEFDVWSSPILANLLWILVSIPLLTMPLALVGLLAVMFHWVDDRRTQVFSIFFNTIRQTWHKCYMLLALDLLVGGFLILNVLIFLEMDITQWLPRISLGATIFTLFIFLMANILAWVLIAVWDAPFKRIVTFAIRLVFVNPFWTVITGGCAILPFLFSLVLPAAVFVTVTGALAAAIAARGTHYLMRTYLPESQYTLLDVSG